MIALLNASYMLRRLALLTVIFIACILVLRSSSSSYNDYLPSWKASTLYNPYAPEQDPYDADDSAILAPGDHVRPEDVISKPEDILPQLQDIPPHSGRPGSSDGEAPNSSPRSRLSLEMQELLSWDPPVEIKDHYPPYDAYKNRDYDPNRWESFEQNNGFYYNGTTRKLPLNVQNPIIYEVYPSYNSADWLEKWRGEFVSCNGPRGIPYNRSTEDFVTVYEGVPNGFPPPDVGSFDAVGLNGHVCFDRTARLGPYGLNSNLPDFQKVKWGQLQNECLDRNSARYKLSTIPALTPGISESMDTSWASKDLAQGVKPRAGKELLQYKPRTALLIRTWDDYDYQENDFQAVRSLISELSLQSGGEYQVFLFVNIKDSNLPIFTDSAVYQKALEDHVPEEFRDIAILWSEKVCTEWYPKVGEWSVYFQQFMPLQWFAEKHPEFDYVWNWEMDARYIGHHYHFLEEITTFSRVQPRKYLWERNSRYYFPAAHGSYDDFVRQTHDVISNSPHVQTVWGAQPWSKDQKITGPVPPTTEAKDDFEWGVDEEADFITLLPMWDPRETWWAYRDKLWGYPASDSSTEDRPYPHVPRRTFINTLTRFSSKLLRAMHGENKLGVSMASEMWPTSVALQHGLKAVYAPHPIWLSHNWPADYLDEVFNADGWGAGSLPGGDIDHGRGVAYDPARERKGQAQTGTGPNGEGRAGRWSQERDSVYNPDREHNFGGWSWYFWSDFPKTLYWRWLGWSSSFNIVTIEGQQSTDELKDANWAEWENNNGRMCLPGMLLHPVKAVKAPPVISFEDEDEEASEEDTTEEESAPDATSSSDDTSSGGDTSPSKPVTTVDDGVTLDTYSSFDNPSSSQPVAPADGVTLDTAASFDTTVETQDSPAFDSPFHDINPLDDNTLTEDSRLVDLPLDTSQPSQPFQGSSPLDDNTLTEDARLSDLPIDVSRPQGGLPQDDARPVRMETSELDTASATIALDSDAIDVDSSNGLSASTQEDTSQYEAASRPHVLPPHAEFAYGGVASPAEADTSDATAFEAAVEESIPPAEYATTANDGITLDEAASIEITEEAPKGPLPIPGTDAPGYNDLFGDGAGAAPPTEPASLY